MEEPIQQEDPEVVMLNNNTSSGYEYQRRRHDPWNEIYSLFRDTVQTNRLTQRQSVNLPLMKLSCMTNLKDIDDMPVIHFENLDNDKQAELFKNEYWKWTDEQNHFELQDIVDKKQEWLYGRTFDQWQVVDGKVKQTILDPMDILVDRFMDPTDIHSSRFLIHQFIFVPLSSLENNPDYDQQQVAELKKWYATEEGIIKLADNQSKLSAKNQKMTDMGVADMDSPILGEVIVELALHFAYRKEKEEDEQIWLYVLAENTRILMKKKLEQVVGVTSDHFFRNHYPYCTWAGDLDKQDFWSDGRGDVVRTPNKVANAYFSQKVENRTLKSFGMHYYDSSLKSEGFMPNTYNPVAWGWYGIPTGGKKLSDVFQKVDIDELADSQDDIEFIMNVIERATGATSTKQGVQTERQITLGEVELALAEAQEKSKSISKFYTQVWKDRGLMFTKLLEAAGDKIDAVKIYTKGKNTDNVFGREISPKDWQTESGYRVRVWTQDEKNSQDTKILEKQNAVKLNMPDNPKVDEIYKRKLVEWAGYTPEEVNEVMEFERKKLLMALPGQSMMQQPMQQQPQPQGGLTPPTMGGNTIKR